MLLGCCSHIWTSNLKAGEFEAQPSMATPFAGSHKKKRSESMSEPELPPLEKAQKQKAVLESRDRASDQEAGEKEIEWLKEQASKLPGYDEFHTNQNRKLKNLEHVKFWAFAAKFVESYFKKPSGIPVRIDDSYS